MSSTVVPMALGAAAVGGLLYWNDRRKKREANEHLIGVSPTVAAASAPMPPPGRWVFPVPRWNGRNPVISDGWGSPRPRSSRGNSHFGADIMFRRRWLKELVELFPPRAPHSQWHFMPAGTPALAASDGVIWSAGRTPQGFTVVISHGAPWATYYTHMTELFVDETARGASKQRVRAGQPIGIIGTSPKDAQGIAHLHFEIWHGGDGTSAIDPEPYLRGWPVIDAPLPN